MNIVLKYIDLIIEFLLRAFPILIAIPFSLLRFIKNYVFKLINYQPDYSTIDKIVGHEIVITFTDK